MPTYAPTLSRQSLVEGPGHIIYAYTNATPPVAEYLWCEGPVQVNLLRPMLDHNVPGFGVVDSRLQDETVEVVFSPAGNIPAAAIAWIFSNLGAMQMNTSRYGAVDTPVKVHCLDGTLITLACAAPTELPTLCMGASNKRWSGNCKVTGILGNGLVRSTAGTVYARQTGQAFSAVPSSSEFVNQPVQATWSTYAIATTQDGWKISVKPKWGIRKDPNIGTFDLRLTGIVCEAQCRPLNMDDALWYTNLVQGASNVIGGSPVAADLTLAENNPGLTFVLKNAKLVNVPVTMGQDEPRMGVLTWRAYRDLSAGFGNLFTVALTA